MAKWWHISSACSCETILNYLLAISSLFATHKRQIDTKWQRCPQKCLSTKSLIWLFMIICLKSLSIFKYGLELFYRLRFVELLDFLARAYFSHCLLLVCHFQRQLGRRETVSERRSLQRLSRSHVWGKIVRWWVSWWGWVLMRRETSWWGHGEDGLMRMCLEGYDEDKDECRRGKMCLYEIILRRGEDVLWLRHHEDEYRCEGRCLDEVITRMIWWGCVLVWLWWGLVLVTSKWGWVLMRRKVFWWDHNKDVF